MGLPVRKSPPAKRGRSRSPPPDKRNEPNSQNSHYNSDHPYGDQHSTNHYDNDNDPPSPSRRRHHRAAANNNDPNNPNNPLSSPSAHGGDPNQPQNAVAQHLFSNPLSSAQEARDEERARKEESYRDQIERQIEDEKLKKKRAKEEEADNDKRDQEKMQREQEELTRRYEEEEKLAKEKQEAELKAQLDKDAEDHRRLKEGEQRKHEAEELKAELKAKRQIEEMNKALETESADQQPPLHDTDDVSSVTSQHVQNQPPPQNYPQHLQNQQPQQQQNNQPPSVHIPRGSAGLFDAPGSSNNSQNDNNSVFAPDSQSSSFPPSRQPVPPSHADPKRFSRANRQQQQQQQQEPPFSLEPSESGDLPRLNTVRDPPPSHMPTSVQFPIHSVASSPDPFSRDGSALNLRSDLGKKLVKQIEELKSAQQQQMFIQQQLLVAQLQSAQTAVPPAPPAPPAMPAMPAMPAVDNHSPIQVGASTTSLGPRLDRTADEAVFVSDWNDKTPFATPRASQQEEHKSPSPSSRSSVDIARDKSRTPSPEPESEPEPEPEPVDATTTLKEDAKAGSSVLHVDSTENFEIGHRILIGGEERWVVGFGSLILDKPLTGSHSSGTVIASLGPPANPAQSKAYKRAAKSHLKSSERAKQEAKSRAQQNLASFNENLGISSPASSPSFTSTPSPAEKHSRTHDVGRMDGLDIAGGADFEPLDSPTTAAARRGHRGTFSGKITVPPPGSVELESSQKLQRTNANALSQSPSGTFSRKFDVGRRDGLDLAGVDPSTPGFKPQDSPTTAAARRGRRGTFSGKITVPADPNGGHATTMSPAEAAAAATAAAMNTTATRSPGKYDQTFDVGRLDGLDVAGLSPLLSPAPQGSSPSRKFRPSADAQFTTPGLSPRKKAKAKILALKAAEQAERGSYDLSFDVGRIDGLDIAGLSSRLLPSATDDDSDSAGVSETLVRQHSAQENLAYPEKQKKPKKKATTDRGRHDLKFDYGSIEGLNLSSRASSRTLKSAESPPPGRLARRMSAKPDLNYKEAHGLQALQSATEASRLLALLNGAADTDADGSRRVYNRHDVRYEVGRFDGLDLQGYAEKYPEQLPDANNNNDNNDKNSLQSPSKFKRRASAKAALASAAAPRSVAFLADDVSSTSPFRAKHSRNFEASVGRLDALDVDGLSAREEFQPPSAARPPRPSLSAMSAFRSPGPHPLPSESSSSSQIIDTILFGEIHLDGASRSRSTPSQSQSQPNNLSEKFSFAADRVMSARNRLALAESKTVDLANVADARVLATKVAADASFKAQLAIHRNRAAALLEEEHSLLKNREGEVQQWMQKHDSKQEELEAASHELEFLKAEQGRIVDENGQLQSDMKRAAQEEQRNIIEAAHLEQEEIRDEAAKLLEKAEDQLEDLMSQKDVTAQELETALEEQERIRELAKEELFRIKEEAESDLEESESRVAAYQSASAAEKENMNRAHEGELERVNQQHVVDLERAYVGRERAVQEANAAGELSKKKQKEETEAKVMAHTLVNDLEKKQLRMAAAKSRADNLDNLAKSERERERLQEELALARSDAQDAEARLEAAHELALLKTSEAEEAARQRVEAANNEHDAHVLQLNAEHQSDVSNVSQKQKEEHEAALRQFASELEAEKARMHQEKTQIKANSLMSRAMNKSKSARERRLFEEQATMAQRDADDAMAKAAELHKDNAARQDELTRAHEAKIAAVQFASEQQAHAIKFQADKVMQDELLKVKSEHLEHLAALNEEKELAAAELLRAKEDEHEKLLQQKESESAAARALVQSKNAEKNAKGMMSKFVSSRASHKEREVLRNQAVAAERMAEEARSQVERTKEEAKQRERDAERASEEKARAAQSAVEAEASAARKAFLSLQLEKVAADEATAINRQDGEQEAGRFIPNYGI